MQQAEGLYQLRHQLAACAQQFVSGKELSVVGGGDDRSFTGVHGDVRVCRYDEAFRVPERWSRANGS
jgi:hypothetical protein